MRSPRGVAGCGAVNGSQWIVLLEGLEGWVSRAALSSRHMGSMCSGACSSSFEFLCQRSSVVWDGGGRGVGVGRK